MRKIIRVIVIVAFTLSLTLLLKGVVCKMLRERQVYERISSLPAFSFLTLTKDDFHSSEITKGPVLIVRFHPECEHCQYEISQILKSDIPSIANKVLLISSDHPDSIGKFLNQFNYFEYPSIMALADTSDSFYDIFGKDIVPSNYIFNKDLKLVKVLLGEVKTETIRKYLQISE